MMRDVFKEISLYANATYTTSIALDKKGVDYAVFDFSKDGEIMIYQNACLE